MVSFLVLFQGKHTTEGVNLRSDENRLPGWAHPVDHHLPPFEPATLLDRILLGDQLKPELFRHLSDSFHGCLLHWRRTMQTHDPEPTKTWDFFEGNHTCPTS